VVGELLRLRAHLAFLVARLLARRDRDEALGRAGLERAAAGERVRLVGDAAAVNGLAVHAVALVVVHLRDRRVDRDLVEVRAAEPGDLRVDVRVDAAGEQRVVREVEAGTTCAVQNATCSVSAKKLSGLRLSTMRPTGRSGTSSSGTIFVASRMSKLNCSPAPR
jgi:hypothetical protein